MQTQGRKFRGKSMVAVNIKAPGEAPMGGTVRNLAAAWTIGWSASGIGLDANAVAGSGMVLKPLPSATLETAFPAHSFL
ncbi:hypothetical protein GCM10025778_20070 [Paeniglutamicibacter antarcticus]|uniref:Uncharacterized protein n=1 Tax=Paeniglutamicibacter antarcticus TaxID=494023 RepID=A0ABP9TKV6_9MICC